MCILTKFTPYLRNIVIDIQESDRWKKQSTVAINFLSPKNVDEERVIH